MRRQAQAEKVAVKVDLIKAVSHKAIKIEVSPHGYPKEVWVPKSQIHEPDGFDYADANVEMHITAWFVKKEGLT
jgi:hypothetical protein